MKYVIIDQIISLEQIHTRLLNHVDNHCWQCYNELTLLQSNTTSVISKWGLFSPFLFLFIFFSMLPSNFTVSGVENFRLYSVLILNVTLLSILFTYILIEGLSIFASCFLGYIQNNLEHRMQNMIPQEDQISQSTLKLIFYIYCFCMTFIYFSMCSTHRNLIKQYIYTFF